MHRRLFMAAVLLLSGCSTIVLLIIPNYATQLRPARQAVSQNNIENAQQLPSKQPWPQ